MTKDMNERIKNFTQFVNETIYYHGTSLPKSNPKINIFKSKEGYRNNPMIGAITKVKSPWVFFTDKYDLARKYGSAKTDGLYHDKGDFTYKTVVLKYDINESDLNILDLTTDDYEFKLESIGISLIEMYGIGMYDQDQLWELLDDDKISNIIIKSGINAIKLIENVSDEYNGYSLAIHMNKVNDVIKELD